MNAAATESVRTMSEWAAYGRTTWGYESWAVAARRFALENGYAQATDNGGDVHMWTRRPDGTVKKTTRKAK